MNRLLVVFLRGAADGLSILTPADSRYRDARPDIATPEADLLTLGADWSMHPSLRNLHKRVSAKTACLVPAVGLPDGDRSHFAAQHRVEIGGAQAFSLGTGWLGRHLAATAPDEPNPLRAVSVGAISLPATLRGTSDAVAAQTLAGLRFGAAPLSGRGGQGGNQGTDKLDPSWFLATWDAAKRTAPGAGVTAASHIEATLAAAHIGESSEIPEDERSGAAAAAFAEASRVFNAGLGTEIVMLNLGGWDTHNAQGVGREGILGTLLADLDTGLDAFLKTHEKDADPVTVLIVTEFGRRVQQNSSGGTDHGKGGVAIVAGATSAGGVVGDWPGLAELDEGDVKAVNPTTQILGEVAQKALSTPDLDKVVPGVDSKKFVGVCR